VYLFHPDLTRSLLIPLSGGLLLICHLSADDPILLQQRV